MADIANNALRVSMGGQSGEGGVDAYTKAESDAKYALKTDITNINNELALKANEKEVNDKFAKTASADDVAIELAKKANVGDSYKKDETYSKKGIDDRLAEIQTTLTTLDERIKALEPTEPK